MVIVYLNNIVGLDTNKNIKLEFLWQTIIVEREKHFYLNSRAWLYTKIYRVLKLGGVFYILSMYAKQFT